MGVLDTFSLAGRVSVVTGANRGIGRALATALAQAGSDVAALVRRPDAVEPTLRELRDLGVRAQAFPADVTDPAQVERAARDVHEAFGRVDVLVNNAGTCIHRPSLDVPAAEWREVLATNLDGVWFCCQAFGRLMCEARRGSIVNIGSMSGAIVNRPQWQPAYNASKAAVHHLTRSLAAEWGPLGVRVNALAPGYIATEMSPVDDPRFHRHWIEDAPMERVGTPEELGPSVVFLGSDASAFMTGSVLTVDGGYSVY